MPDILTGNYDGTTNTKPHRQMNGPNYFLSRPSNEPLGSGKRLARGLMRSTAGPRTHFHFMYNPPEVNYSYDIDQSKLSYEAMAEDPEGLLGINNLVNGASISFMLYFDRSVEMASAPASDYENSYNWNAGHDSPDQVGVLYDLNVYEQLIGEVATGTVVSKPIRVMFSRGQQVTALNFRGFITGTHVVFKQFNQDMIPTRMEMEVHMRKLYVPKPDPLATTGASAAGAGSDAGQASGHYGAGGSSNERPPEKASTPKPSPKPGSTAPPARPDSFRGVDAIPTRNNSNTSDGKYIDEGGFMTRPRHI